VAIVGRTAEPGESHNAGSLAETAAQIEGDGGQAHPIVADLSDPALDRAEIVAEARAALGGIDVLVNNAGVFPVKTLADCTADDYEECFSVNVRAPFLLARAFAPEMAAAGWGRILNIGSSSAYAGFKETSLYCASKHALLGLSRALHDELKSSGVRVLCASPGSVQTPMGRLVKNQDFSTFLDPAEVADVAVDLLARDGSMAVDEIRLNRMTIR
jgi:NAD(P)-dependent dehydrogenase (short-subunit alcohol dehydrogenase family)